MVWNILQVDKNILQVNKRDIRAISLTLFWCLYCQLWTFFTHFSSASVADFEQVRSFPPTAGANKFSKNAAWAKWIIIIYLVGDDNLRESFACRHQLSIFWLMNTFSNNPNTINLKILPNHGIMPKGVYRKTSRIPLEVSTEGQG